MEVNATSDMDFFMSVAQVRLLLDLFNTNIACFLALETKQASVPSESDSSMSSTQVILRNVQSNPELDSKQETVSATLWDHITPFSVLLTAGKISCMMYSHKLTTREKRQQETAEFVIGSPVVKKVKTKGSLEFREEAMSTATVSSADSGVDSIFSSTLDVQPQTFFSVVPFLFATFSQPHTFFSVQSDQQRADLACYDIVLKGTRSDFSNSSMYIFYSVYRRFFYIQIPAGGTIYYICF